MRIENEGMAFWYATTDAPAPVGNILLREGQREAIVTITVGVQPASASNSVIVRFSVNGGPPQALASSFSHQDVKQRAQYFSVRFPPLRVGDRVDYTPVFRYPGGQIPTT